MTAVSLVVIDYLNFKICPLFFFKEIRYPWSSLKHLRNHVKIYFFLFQSNINASEDKWQKNKKTH